VRTTLHKKIKRQINHCRIHNICLAGVYKFDGILYVLLETFTETFATNRNTHYEKTVLEFRTHYEMYNGIHKTVYQNDRKKNILHRWLLKRFPFFLNVEKCISNDWGKGGSRKKKHDEQLN